MLIVCFVVFDKGILLGCYALKRTFHLSGRYVLFFHRQIPICGMDGYTNLV
ncbi:hypothetical protein EZS27_030968 [termite gut metagenome]|uniref:Uncharacterized protein n=1 Tax=termite gut metagenome TaxID=433724 RepID=A0A5J4QDB8_9ZZZZ